jgi:hypothetical protein
MITRFRKTPDVQSIKDYKTICRTWRNVLDDLNQCKKIQPLRTAEIYEKAAALADHICKVSESGNDFEIDSLYMAACNHYGIEYKNGDYCGMMCDLIKTRY